jgi:hypothetical protein
MRQGLNDIDDSFFLYALGVAAVAQYTGGAPLERPRTSAVMAAGQSA